MFMNVSTSFTFMFSNCILHNLISGHWYLFFFFQILQILKNLFPKCYMNAPPRFSIILRPRILLLFVICVSSDFETWENLCENKS